MSTNKVRKPATALVSLALALGASAGLAATAQAAPAPVATGVTVVTAIRTGFISSPDGFANIRSGPGTRFDILGRLNNGASVSVVEVRSGWSRISTGGWISNTLIRSTAPATGWFRVQIGAFNSRANANARAAQARSKGFQTYVRNVGGQWLVQVGAFRNEANARTQLAKARAAGFTDAFIQTTR